MGDYDFTQIIQNVFVGDRSLDRFLFLLNNNELSFKIKGGTAYDGSTNANQELNKSLARAAAMRPKI